MVRRCEREHEREDFEEDLGYMCGAAVGPGGVHADALVSCELFCFMSCKMDITHATLHIL